jgi:hypothetical protein
MFPLTVMLNAFDTSPPEFNTVTAFVPVALVPVAVSPGYDCRALPIRCRVFPHNRRRQW